MRVGRIIPIALRVYATGHGVTVLSATEFCQVRIWPFDEHINGSQFPRQSTSYNSLIATNGTHGYRQTACMPSISVYLRCLPPADIHFLISLAS